MKNRSARSNPDSTRGIGAHVRRTGDGIRARRALARDVSRRRSRRPAAVRGVVFTVSRRRCRVRDSGRSRDRRRRRLPRRTGRVRVAGASGGPRSSRPRKRLPPRLRRSRRACVRRGRRRVRGRVLFRRRDSVGVTGNRSASAVDRREVPGFRAAPDAASGGSAPAGGHVVRRRVGTVLLRRPHARRAVDAVHRNRPPVRLQPRVGGVLRVARHRRLRAGRGYRGEPRRSTSARGGIGSVLRRRRRQPRNDGADVGVAPPGFGRRRGDRHPRRRGGAVVDTE